MRRLVCLTTAGLFSLACLYACAGGGESDQLPAAGSAGTSGVGGSGGASGSGGVAGSSGQAGGGASGGSAGASGGASGSAGASGGSAGADASAGTGGIGGSDAAADAAGWPTCDAQPTGVPAKTIPQIWADNPSSPTPVWVSGVYATAISGSGCVAGSTCQIFLQQDQTYASLAAGAQHAIKLRISSPTATYFTGLAVGDKLDVLGHAWRFNLNGANELLIQVNAQLQGCAKKIGVGTPTPITGVMLSDLTPNAYEQTLGPLLVRVANVSGKPAGAGEIFGIWPTGIGIGDAGTSDLVSISPYFLLGYKFAGLPTGGQTVVNFQTVTGVFGQYIPIVEGGSPPKYHVLYPRTMSDLVQ